MPGIAVCLSTALLAGSVAGCSGSGEDVSAYVEHALTLMDEGLHADSGEWAAAREAAVEGTSAAATVAETYADLSDAVHVAGGDDGFLWPAEDAEARRVTSVDTSAALPAATYLEGGVVLLTVPGLGDFGLAASAEESREYADLLAQVVADAEPSAQCGWLVDVRDTGESDPWPLLAGLSPLLGPGRVLGLKGARGDSEVGIEGSAVVVDGRTQAEASTGVPAQTDKRIGVLQGKDSGPGGEVVVTAFRGQPGTRTFGRATAGTSVLSRTHELSDGALLRVPVARLADRQDGVLAGAIPADEVVQGGPANPEAVEAGRSWVAEGCAPS